MDEGRIKAALEAIKSTMGTEAGEYGIDLFITHHLKELDGSEWKELLGNESPNAQQVFDSLVLSEQLKGHP